MSDPYIPAEDRLDVIGRLTARLEEEGEESLREKAAARAEHVFSKEPLIHDKPDLETEKPPPKEEGSKDFKDDKEGKDDKDGKETKDVGEKDDKDAKEDGKEDKDFKEGKDDKDGKDVKETDEKDFKDAPKDDKEGKEDKDGKDVKDTDDKDLPDEGGKPLIVDAPPFDRQVPADPEQETERQDPDYPVL